MAMVINEEHKNQDDMMEKLQGFIDAAMKAVTADMVNDIATKVVGIIEVADDIVQPETIDLLRKLPDVSRSLEHTLDKIKIIEENGTLDTLIHLAELVGTMKNSMTGPMISDMVDKGIQGVEFADDLLQKGALQLVDGMVTAFDKAQQERKDKEPLSTLQMLRTLTDKETREGISLLLAFVKQLPSELKKKN